MPFVETASGLLYYAARGASGAPVVLIHGAGDSHLVWNGQLAGLADLARTRGVDLPGHGRSSGGGCTSIPDYARAVIEFLDALALEQAVLVGASMGGAIALTCALEFPERVRGLGLVGTGAKLRVAPAFLDGLRRDFERTVGLLVESYYAPGASAVLKEKSARQLRLTGADVTYGDFAACNQFDVMTRLAEIRVPALVLCGREDKMTPPKYSEFLAQHLPHARLMLVEQAGHMVMLEQPLIVNRALREWLTSSIR